MANKEKKASKKLKWKYDRARWKYVSGKMVIAKAIMRTNQYVLYRNYRRIRIVGFFKKLSSAKKVAQLISNG